MMNPYGEIKKGDYLLTYDELLEEANNNGIKVRELPLSDSDGRINGKRIAIRKGIPVVKKICVLCEELGHYYTTVGNIIDQKSTNEIKQEVMARKWSYDKLIGLTGIIRAFNNNCLNIYDMADHLNVDIEFLNDALNYYRQKYGVYTTLDNYIIYFEPNLAVLKMI
ncbi:MAG: hypothetical protein PUC65_11610 [Clostridiales bacterium]|nr:hypothetical protein [Clostridiales bacterium]